jgi:hypothetical protein
MINIIFQIGKLIYYYEQELDYACRPIKINFTTSSTVDKFENSILMIERSKNCSIIDQIKNIQIYGGRLAVIIDSNSKTENIKNINFIRNPKDKELKINGIIITKKHGDFLKESLNLFKDIRIKVTSELNVDSEKIEFYFTSIDLKMYQFLKEFRKYFQELGKF